MGSLSLCGTLKTPAGKKVLPAGPSRVAVDQWPALLRSCWGTFPLLSVSDSKLSGSGPRTRPPRPWPNSKDDEGWPDPPSRANIPDTAEVLLYRTSRHSCRRSTNPSQLSRISCKQGQSKECAQYFQQQTSTKCRYTNHRSCHDRRLGLEPTNHLQPI